MLKSRALAELDALFARIDQDPDLCYPCKVYLSERPRNDRYEVRCDCPPSQ